MTILIALSSAVCWSVFDLKRKQLVEHIPSLQLSWFLALAVLPLYLLLNALSWPAWPQSSYWYPALGSLLVSTLAAVCFIEALRVGQIARLVPLLALTPVIAALFGFFWLQQALAPREWLAGAAVVVLLFLLNGGGRDFQPGPGATLMLLVALGWGSGTVFDKLALQSASPLLHALLQTSGMVLLLGVLIVLRRLPLALKALHQQRAALLLAALFFCAAVSLQLLALRELHPGIIEALKRGLGIVGALLWGWLFFAERIGRQQMALAALLVVAIVVLVWP